MSEIKNQLSSGCEKFIFHYLHTYSAIFCATQTSYQFHTCTTHSNQCIMILIIIVENCFDDICEKLNFIWCCCCSSRQTPLFKPPCGTKCFIYLIWAGLVELKRFFSYFPWLCNKIAKTPHFSKIPSLETLHCIVMHISTHYLSYFYYLFNSNTNK